MLQYPAKVKSSLPPCVSLSFLAEAHRRQPVGRVGKKLEVIRAAARLDYPTGDIDRVLAEIEMGYGSGAHP
jgi:hypothetical protein